MVLHGLGCQSFLLTFTLVHGSTKRRPEGSLGSRHSPPHPYCAAASQLPFGEEDRQAASTVTLSSPAGLVAWEVQNGWLEVSTCNSMKTVSSLPLRTKTSKLVEPNTVGTRNKSFVSGHSRLDNRHPRISDPNLWNL